MIKKMFISIIIFFQKIFLKRQIKKGKEFKVIVLPTLSNEFVGLGDSRQQRILEKAKGLMNTFDDFLLLGIENKEAQKLNIITGTMDIKTRCDSEGWPTHADIMVTVTIDYKKILNFRGVKNG